MIDLGNGLKIVSDEEIRLVVRYTVEEIMRQGKPNAEDVQYLTPAKLAPIVNVGDSAIRAAIKAGHYGQTDSESGRCYATVSECRAWHFGGKQKAQEEKALARSRKLFSLD